MNKTIIKYVRKLKMMQMKLLSKFSIYFNTNYLFYLKEKLIKLLKI
jgi:hypothetical protein